MTTPAGAGHDFQPGELVDIIIRGARVVQLARPGYLRVDLDTGPQLAIMADHPAVTVERVAPAEWPPRPGDVWRDRDGSPWFAATVIERGGNAVVRMLSGLGHEPSYQYPATFVQRSGPLTLVHREPEPEGGEDS